MVRDFSQELASFRKAAINVGIITEGQASAIQFVLLGQDEIERVITAMHGGVNPEKIMRCQCRLCQQAKEFFAIAIDGTRISDIQSQMLVQLYSAGLGSPLEMEDCGVRQEGKERAN